MNLNFLIHYVEFEIPELEDREMVGRSFFLKIHGIEYERPLIRINNKLYEGKWVLKNSYFVFSKENTKLPSLQVNIDRTLFEKNPKIKVKIIELKKNLNSKKIYSNSSICSKKLKLYRIPLTLNSKLII